MGETGTSWWWWKSPPSDKPSLQQPHQLSLNSPAVTRSLVPSVKAGRKASSPPHPLLQQASSPPPSTTHYRSRQAAPPPPATHYCSRQAVPMLHPPTIAAGKQSPSPSTHLLLQQASNLPPPPATYYCSRQAVPLLHPPTTAAGKQRLTYWRQNNKQRKWTGLHGSGLHLIGDNQQQAKWGRR